MFLCKSQVLETGFAQKLLLSILYVTTILVKLDETFHVYALFLTSLTYTEANTEPRAVWTKHWPKATWKVLGNVILSLYSAHTANLTEVGINFLTASRNIRFLFFCKNTLFIHMYIHTSLFNFWWQLNCQVILIRQTFSWGTPPAASPFQNSRFLFKSTLPGGSRLQNCAWACMLWTWYTHKWFWEVTLSFFRRNLSRQCVAIKYFIGLVIYALWMHNPDSSIILPRTSFSWVYLYLCYTSVVQYPGTTCCLVHTRSCTYSSNWASTKFMTKLDDSSSFRWETFMHSE